MDKWLSLWSIGQEYTLADFQKIKDSGFMGVEVWAEHQQADGSFQYAQACGLEIGLHLPFHDLNLATLFEEIGTFAFNIMQQWLKKLADYGGGHAVIHGGMAYASEDRVEAQQQLTKRLTALNDFAKEHQIDLLFENQIPDQLNYTHIFPSSVEEWIRTLKDTGAKACLDVGHLAIQEDEFEGTVDALGDSLKSIHLSDNDGLSDLHLLPSDGKVFEPHSLCYLEKVDYYGPIVFEINPYKYSLKDILEHPSVTNF